MITAIKIFAAIVALWIIRIIYYGIKAWIVFMEERR